MKVLITGASGYLGNRLAHQLAEEGNQVVAFIRSSKDRDILNHPNIVSFIGDIADPDSIAVAMQGCRQVYHLAGYARLWANDSSIFYTINLTGTKNLLDAARQQQIEKLVYTSSTAVFGPSLREPITENDPRSIAFDNHYDLSKHLAEQEVYKYMEEGHSAVIVNPSRVFGPGLKTSSNAITAMIKKAIEGKIIFLPGKSTTIGNYAYIEDVVHGHINAMTLGKPGERYILGGENISYKELARIIEQFIGPFPVIQIPFALAKIVLYGITAYKKITRQEAVYSASGIKRYARNTCFDCSKACQEISYKITPLKMGIETTIQKLLNELPCQLPYSQL